MTTSVFPVRLPEVAEIGALLEVRPSDLERSGIVVTPSMNAVKRLDVAKGLYVPSPTAVLIAQKLIRDCRAFSETTYESVETYRAGVFRGVWPKTATRMHCITGLAGVGKSAFVGRLNNLLNAIPLQPLAVTGLEVDLRLSILTTVRRRLSSSAVLSSLLGDDTGSKRTQGGLVLQVTQRLRFAGVVLHLVDELQFVSLSAGASSNLAGLLLSIHELQVPTAFVTNFSGLVKLMKRPQEDRDRLLRNVGQIDPFSPSDAGWSRLLEHLDTMLDPCLDFSLASEHERLWELSFGLPRALFDLLQNAFDVIDRPLRPSDLMNVFRSDAVSQLREDVHLLHRTSGGTSSSSKKLAEQRGLISPIRPSIALPQSRTAESLSVDSVDAQLTAPERAVIRELRRELQTVNELATGRRLPRPKSASSAQTAALDNAMRLAGLQTPDLSRRASDKG